MLYKKLVSYKKINNEQTFKINNIDTFNKLPSKLKTEIVKNGEFFFIFRISCG